MTPNPRPEVQVSTAPDAAPARSVRGAKRLGLTIASYRRLNSKVVSERFPPWNSALDVLDHCATLNAGCLQIGVRSWTDDFAGQVREKREKLGIVLEGQIALPRNESDVEPFTATVRRAKEAGASILRAVCLSGRRYETFQNAEQWKAFRDQSWKSLTLAEPVMKQVGVKLAVENHKDWRLNEQLEWLRRLDSEWVGVCFDFGNNLALLEDPRVLAEALAPFVLTTHLKDMGVQAYENGFLLSEVPLGDGLLDLQGLIAICEKANPNVQLNLEMITRDPLEVPVLQEAYWATLGDVPARDLAATMALVNRNPPQKPLPRISDKSPEDQLSFEEANVRQCFDYARQHLGL